MSALSREIAPAEAPSGKGGASSRIREVDGFRAIAALMVVIFHAWTVGYQPFRNTPFQPFVMASDFGVSLFFALSGMVTFLPMVRGALSGKVPSGRSFLGRRLFRLLPLYYLLIILVWASRFAGTPSDFSSLLEHLTFTQVYDKQHIFWLLGPAWSLADELHYYVLIALLGPPLARLAARRATTGGRLAVMATLPAAVLAASLTYTAIVTYAMHIPITDSWVYFNPLARADSFAEGLLVAIMLSVPGVQVIRRRPGRVVFGVGVALAVGLQVVRYDVPVITTYYFAFSGLCAAFLLAGAAMLDERQLMSRVLRWRPFQFWALVGFSLYLVHEPVMLQLARWHVLYFLDPTAWVVSTVALIAVATFVAWLTYTLIERPGMRLQQLIGELRARQHRTAARRSGPPPRWLPDLTLATADGVPVSLRELPRDRPVLFALEHEGARGLAEQRFRLDAGEADGFYVTATQDGDAPVGTTLLVDRDERLSAALNGGQRLIEVSPGGLITAMIGDEGARAEVPA